MSELLKYVDLKLKRVTEQISALEQKITDWSQASPLKVKVVFNEGRLGYKVYVDEIWEAEEIEWLGVFVNECIHNMRSLLDNLAYALACLTRNPPKNLRDISFPIFIDKNYKNWKKKNYNSFDYKILKRLHRIQPCHRSRIDIEGSPETDPLYLLNYLSNLDKHRIPIYPEAINLQQLSLNIGAKFYTDEDASKNVPPNISIFAGSLLKQGDLIYEHRTISPIKEAFGETNISMEIKIKINNKPEELISFLKYLNWYVNLVVDEFRIFFNQNKIYSEIL